MEIRHFDADVAEGAAELFRQLQPSVLTTAEYLIHREQTLPGHARRLALVALDRGAVVGWGSAMRRWPGGGPDEAAVWVMVTPTHRGHGLGAELMKRAEQHAIAAGATILRTFVENDPAGLGFLERRGYEVCGTGVVSTLEPYPAEISRRHGLQVATLSELAGAEEPLFELWGEAGAFPPGATGGVPTFDEWRRFILGNPLLDPEGSFTLLRAGRPVALSWLLVDRERLKAEHEWTATLPELRGQGLARLAKLHAIRWAAEHGFRELLTDNDSDNIAMLELNRSLGFRELWRRRYFRRSI